MRVSIKDKMYPGFQWYILRVVPQREQRVSAILDVLRQTPLLPHGFLVREVWFPFQERGGRTYPTVPGYVFLRTILTGAFYTYFKGGQFPFVFGWLQRGQSVLSVTDVEIDCLREEEQVASELPQSVPVGATVQLDMQRFGSMVGEVLEVHGERVKIKTMLFHRAFDIDVSLNDIWRVL